MTGAEHLPLADEKNRLSEVVERLEREHGRVVITKHGRAAAVVLSIEDLEGLEETLEILSDRPLMNLVKKAVKEIEGGNAPAAHPGRGPQPDLEFGYGSLADNPQRLGHGLHLEMLGMRSARRGECRVIYRIDLEQRTIHVAAMDHLSEV
jgi:antitoxin YefM